MPSRAQRAKTAERRAQAIQLRLSGVDWQTIADRLGYSDRAAACKDVSRALETNQKAAEKAGEDYRVLELARLDRLQAALWAQALHGDHKAVDTLLRLMQRRAKMLGLDEAPDGADTARSMLGDLSRALGTAADALAAEDPEER